MKFEDVMVEEITSFKQSILYEIIRGCLFIITSDGDVISTSKTKEFYDSYIIVRMLSKRGSFILYTKVNKKILKICGKCDKINHTTTTLQDAEMFRDLYKACNYDIKTFVALMKI